MRALSSDFGDEDKRPYFLWDEDISLQRDLLLAFFEREFGFFLTGP